MRSLGGAATFCLVGAALHWSVPAVAQPEQIANKDVYVLAEELADEVELIREVMGKPYDDSPRLPVAGVSMAEVFFQAQTLLRKSNQLARELAGSALVTAPAAPNREIQAADIYGIVKTALEQIRAVKAELGITEPVIPTERETDIAPTGLFSTIIDSNRQLNLLIERPITSADVYEQITFAVIYTAGILAKLAPDAVVEPAPFEGPKLPADVYRRLLDCVDIVNRVARTEGVEVLSLSSRRNVPDDIKPGHVYDIANIVVADIAVLAKVVGATPAEMDFAPKPKHIFPSHAYQRAGTLEKQLQALEAHVK